MKWRKANWRQWLKPIDSLNNTVEGTPQGGIASPVLANITLDGLEKVCQAIGKIKDKIHFVRYADDWIVTASTKEILEEKVLTAITAFLKERGLELSPEKTKITHIEEGFDFLGFNIRKYGRKLLIKPGDKGIKALLSKVEEIVDRMRGATAKDLILRLNPIIQGWANHNKHVVSKQIFSQVDHIIFQKIKPWAIRRHPNKCRTWIKNKYFKRIGNRDWVFFAYSNKIGDTKSKDIITLKRAFDTPIVRHIKIKTDSNPYGPKFSEYFEKRRRIKMMRSRAAQ